jgi:predicted nucleic acid-binding protein
VPARSLRAAFEAGQLVVFAPPLLHLEIVNVAGRRWHWPEAVLVDLAVSLEELSFDVREPELASVARWTARGLTAYVAAYVALAEGEGIRLVTDDDPIVSVAPGIAIALADHRGDPRAACERGYAEQPRARSMGRTRRCANRSVIPAER